jgi:hypothetical protein
MVSLHRSEDGVWLIYPMGIACGFTHPTCFLPYTLLKSITDSVT